MHFPIIELTTKKKTPEQIVESSVDYDDPLLQSECDYFGKEYANFERVDLIRSDDIKKLFEGIAEVDVKEECVRFYSEEKIRKTLDDYYLDVLKQLDKNKDFDGWEKFFYLREFGKVFRSNCSLIIVNGCSCTTMMFFEDSYHYADKVLYFGQIYDAHC